MKVYGVIDHERWWYYAYGHPHINDDTMPIRWFLSKKRARAVIQKWYDEDYIKNEKHHKALNQLFHREISIDDYIIVINVEDTMDVNDVKEVFNNSLGEEVFPIND